MSRMREEIDALTAFFTTDAESREPSPIELLLLGHLPVRAGLWLVPYAATRVDEGPVVLIRFDGDHLLAQELGGDAQLAGMALPESLEDAMATLAQTTARWVMAPPAGPDLLRELSSSPDALTLVTGVDQAAVVAAYQILKTVAGSLESPCLPPPHIEIAVVGTQKEEAAPSIQRLQETARDQLDLLVHGGQCVPRIDAVVACTRSGAWRIPRLHLNDVMAMLHDAADGTSPETTAVPPSRAPEPEIVVPPKTMVSQEASERVEPVPVMDAAEDAEQVEEDLTPICSEPTTDESAGAGQLATHVPGLEPVAMVCPDAPDVQWGRCGDGALHALAWHEQLRQVNVARVWAVRHRTLVEQATSCRVDDRLEAHLFTDVPLDVADLHGADVALHVLSPVQIGDQVGWYTAALNDPS